MTPQVLPVASAPPQAGRVRSDPEGGGNTAEPRGFQDTLALTISVEEQGKGTEKSPAGPRTAKEKDDASQTSQAPAALASLLLQMSAGGNVPRPLVAADGGPDAGSAGVQGITAQNVAGLQVLNQRAGDRTRDAYHSRHAQHRGHARQAGDADGHHQQR